MQVESIFTCSRTQITCSEAPPVSSATMRLTSTTERPILPLPTCILRPTPDTAGILAISIPIIAATSPVKYPFLALSAGLAVSRESRLANRVVSTAYLPIPPPYIRTQIQSRLFPSPSRPRPAVTSFEYRFSYNYDYYSLLDQACILLGLNVLVHM
ncbi:hypothetical protein GYMLUDRAFT_967236 [Collybiopsis luxurians FD-317 M1]|uniref:Uncharacterized protein n=1 Tax=Collybiopsis luxurians FD-317 M1 TaxID=944289 RepID=A0A0D0C3J2_9AGAR|nr:hypothetical protein GYMLUDRAFT_967236 [Collybiopsis luxurians FD-317 M1]